MHAVSVYAINLVKKLTRVIGMNLKFVQHVVNKSRFLKLISFMIKQFRRNTRKTMQNSTPHYAMIRGIILKIAAEKHDFYCMIATAKKYIGHIFMVYRPREKLFP